MKRRGAAEGGFTVLELMIVVLLIGLLSAAFGSQLGLHSKYDPRDSARVLASELRYASERAIATDATHRWVVELDEQRYRIERIDEKDPEAEGEKLATTAQLLDLKPPLPTFESNPIDTTAGEWHRLEGSEGVDVEVVRIGDTEYKKGSAAISFASTGAADPAEIELLARETGERVRIQVLPFTSEVRVADSTDADFKR